MKKSKLTLLPIVLAFNNYAVAGSPLKSPEIEVLSAFDRIDTLKTRLETERHLSSSLGYGSAPISALKAFNNAIIAYESKEYLSALRNIEHYIAETNIPDHKTQTKSHLIAAKSANAIGKTSLAFDHYLEFLSLSTKPGTSSNDEIRATIAEILNLTATIKPRAKYKFSQILSSIVAMDAPDDLKSEILFLAAKAATNFNMNKQAEKWIEEASSKTKSSELKLKGKYYMALIEITNGNLEKARKTLLKALKDNKSSSNLEEYAVAQMALARIAYTIGDFNEAIEFYKAIPVKSPSYPDATYETIFAYFKLGDSQNAFLQAKKFTEQNPSHEKARFTNSLMSYLGVKSGKLSETEKNLKNDIAFLTKFANEIKGKFSAKESFDESELQQVKSESTSFASQSPYLEKALNLYSKIDTLKGRSAKIQGKITGAMNDLWNTRLHDIFPKHIERAKQLKENVYELLDIAHRLSASEYHLAKSSLAPDDVISVERSTQRRILLLNKHNEFKRYHENMKELANSISTHTKIASTQTKLIHTQRDFASLELGASKVNKQEQNTKFDLRTIKAKLRAAKLQLGSITTQHRKAYLKALHKQTPLFMITELMTTYSLDLLTESKIMAAWRNGNLNPTTKKLSWDYHDAWIKWFNAADIVFEELARENNKIAKTTEALASRLAALQASKQEALMTLYKLEDELSQVLGKDANILSQHYANAANARISEKQKWLADIEWLRFKSMDQKTKKLEQDYKNDLRQLDENLTDQLRGINNK